MWGRLPTFFYSLRLPRDNMSDELEHVVVEGLDDVGYDLVELRKGGSRSRPVLEVRIDRRDGEKVTVDDCARASRALEARLDSSSLVAERYVLQVSSPGERPLRTADEWRRFVGRWANVLAPEFGGRFDAVIDDVDELGGEAVVTLRPDRGEAKRIPLAAVKEARLAFRF
jgi:ribosome maturation factor RimP